MGDVSVEGKIYTLQNGNSLSINTDSNRAAKVTDLGHLILIHYYQKDLVVTEFTGQGPWQVNFITTKSK